MVEWRKSSLGKDPNEIAAQAAFNMRGGWAAVVFSALALAFSVYSVWETSLKQSNLKVFVPPIIEYAGGFQNSNFEVFSIPVTITNEGARTGTVLSMELEAFDPRTNQTKRFYAASFGLWPKDPSSRELLEPFAPMSLAGRSSRTVNALFYTRGAEEKVQELVREIGPYRFTLKLEEAANDEFGFLDRFWASAPVSVTFERDLQYYDARNRTLPLISKDWRSTISGVP